MNDFTKVELQDIAFALDTVYLGNSELKAKVQKMIDSYCEHEWRDATEYFSGSKRICEKCSTIHELMIDGVLETRLIKYE